jgi:predicted PurR-regulated permease PerM
MPTAVPDPGESMAEAQAEAVAQVQAQAEAEAQVAVAEAQTERRATGLLRAIAGTTSSLAGLLAQFIVLIFLGLYWSLENEWFERLWISLLPANRRQRARRTWHAVETNVGAHIRSELTQSVVAFFLLWAGFWAMGIDYPLLLAWACALAWLVPLAGWLIALLPVLLIGLLAGPLVMVGAALYMTIIFALMEFVVEPRLDRRRRAGSVLGLVVALVLLEAMGIVGLLIASPVAVAISAFFGTAFAVTPEPAPAPPRSATLEELQQRLIDLRAAVGRAHGEIPPRTRSL